MRISVRADDDASHPGGTGRATGLPRRRCQRPRPGDGYLGVSSRDRSSLAPGQSREAVPLRRPANRPAAASDPTGRGTARRRHHIRQHLRRAAADASHDRPAPHSTEQHCLRAGPAPDRFLLGLAVLSLLAEVEAERPVVCVIDDAQWLDRPSTQTLAFVARRLGAESVALVFALRDRADEQSFAGLPQLVLGGLRPGDARELLATAIPGPLDERVRDRVVAETRGNPLALLELPQDLSYAELAGGFGLLDAKSLAGRIEDSFRRRLTPLPPDLRRLVLVAALEPIGEPSLVRRAAQRLGIAVDAVEPAELAGLLHFDERITFRHPLVRSAIYREATPQERREAYRALADVTDPAVDADRRAWYLAHAARGPDENVAAELEHSAGWARARGGLAAAAAFLERAAVLTPDPAHRAGRALSAAQAKIQAGAFDAALDLLATAEAGPLSELQQARVDVLRAQLAFVTNRGRDAPPLLLKAAKRLEPIDAELSRATYLDALSAAIFAGLLANQGGGALEVARAASAAPRPLRAPRAPDLLLDGLAANFNEGYAAGVPILRQALTTFGRGIERRSACRFVTLERPPDALRAWCPTQQELTNRIRQPRTCFRRHRCGPCGMPPPARCRGSCWPLRWRARRRRPTDNRDPDSLGQRAVRLARQA
jgi:hypothetical protein